MLSVQELSDIGAWLYTVHISVLAYNDDADMSGTTRIEGKIEIVIRGRIFLSFSSDILGMIHAMKSLIRYRHLLPQANVNRTVLRRSSTN